MDVLNVVRDVKLDKQSKAAGVLETGREFQRMLLKHGHAAEMHYYVHALIHHLPDQILGCPVDILSVSSSALEELNQYHKRLMQRHTNHKKRVGHLMTNHTDQALHVGFIRKHLQKRSNQSRMQKQVPVASS